MEDISRATFLFKEKSCVMIMASQMPSGEETPRFPKARHQLIRKTQLLQKNS